tara:strand:+ start:1048 stop:2631 length:1584 start_codon:yes stop_codon:yes gene_type:complete
MKIRITVILILLSFIFTQSFIENLKSQTPIWTGSFGTVVIDGDIYNQISMRPELNYRNWGIGFDFYLYIDANGKLYDETWKFNTVKNTYRTILDKFRYIRYGYPGDQLYFRVGSLTNVTIGNGILVSSYSNAMEYPEEKKIGLQLGKNFPKGIGFDLIVSDFRKTPGLISVILDYPLSPKFNIEFSYCVDINQTGALDDSDDDKVPDFIDDFPNNNNYAIDTDGDGLADELDFDADGDGFDWHIHTDYNSYEEAFANWNSDLQLDPNNIIDNQKDKITFSDLKESVSGLGLSLTYYINENFKFYSEAAKLFSKCEDCILSDGSKWTPGYGLTPFGFRGHYGPFSFKMEYRHSGRHFLYNYWDRAYEINRAILNDINGETRVETKSRQLFEFGKLQGLYLDMGGSFLNIINIGLSYQDLIGEMWNNERWEAKQNNRSFISSIGLNTAKIPRLKYFNGFYQRSNVRNPLDFKNPDENTVYGYNLGVDISESMLLVYKARYSYKFDGLDLDGNSTYKQVYSMFVETQVLF